MNGLTFRTGVASDIPSLHKLIERAYRGEEARKGWTHEADLLDGQRTDVAALDEILSDQRQRMILAEENGVLIGCVQIASPTATVGYLGHLSVDPAYQGRGLGRRLVSAAEASAVSEFGAQSMEMTVIGKRTELIDWYRRRGYETTGEQRPFPIGNARFGIPKTDDLDFVVLTKSLPGAISVQ